MNSKFFTFSQNNSGGSFARDNKNGIGEWVIVEADNADDANNRAESLGIYFDGCEIGMDCDCCGDRWYRASEMDGTATPEIYGEPIEICEKSFYRKDVFVHYMDGTFRRFELKNPSN
jgi:hypothetical protein